MADLTPAVVTLTNASTQLAERIAAMLGGEVHGLARRVDTEITFDSTMEHLRALFASGRPIIGICAAGILIRAIAPFLSEKHSEPPVIAVSEDGAHVVPLIAGHHGANTLAHDIATEIHGSAAITTAGDTRFGIALDEPPAGWTLANPEAAKPMAAALLEGTRPQLEGRDAAELRKWLEPFTKPSPTDKPGAILTSSNLSLTFFRQSIVIGVGCARDCPAEELSDLVASAIAAAGCAQDEIAAVASLDLKADETAMLAVAGKLGVPFRIFSAAELEAETPRLANPSDIVFAEVGCHGVAEGAALATVGPSGNLIVEKQKSANATVALARASEPLVDLPGRQRGQVSLIGIGPGQAAWRTPEASRLVAQADELVGYGFYIDLLGPLAIGKPRADFPLGGEEDRCRYALEEAAKGRDIALICSGDAGIYAMGALVYELMARPEYGTPRGVSGAARRVEVVTAPGISALQAAAARIGAPLGHDFCAISLSDLLTPRTDIERRIEAAAMGDFVIAFYNPVSKRRKDLFVKAIDTLCGHRPSTTPVLLARSLGRPDESLRLTTIADVRVEEVDMMTVVLVGSSQTRNVKVGGQPRMFTPRGYAAKHADKSASDGIS
ncbi:MAG: precorrin-3B C(17)-methyltransferase [Paracoccaceae bacterium]